MIFWRTMRFVFLLIANASASCIGSSFIRTQSAVSMALSAPVPPIATPMSADAITGASFMPSPTNITFSLSGSSDFILSVISLLFSGRSSA